MSHDVPVTGVSYDKIVAANIRAERARAGLDQVVVVERMQALGFTTWHRQTMGKVERGERRLLGAEEISGLALALGTTVTALMSPSLGIQTVVLPSGDTIPAETIRGLCRGGFAFPVNWGDGDRVA